MNFHNYKTDLRGILLSSLAILKSCEKNAEMSALSQDEDYPKEYKAPIDNLLNDFLLNSLSRFGKPILSEESSLQLLKSNPFPGWIIDPLDGTYNFAKQIGPCSISIAYINSAGTIEFGAMADYPSGNIYFGGKDYGAYIGNRPISVSKECSIDKALLYTGIPSRNDVTNNECLMQLFTRVSKVRMLGSASVSLANVAQGLGEVYQETGIMLWDVAAGLAILEGAGGAFSITPMDETAGTLGPLHVIATNGLIPVSTFNKGSRWSM